jgi:hypothetical protein
VGIDGLWGGSWWVAGWLTVGLWGGSRWWFSFLVDSSGFGCGFFLLFCFTLLQTHSVQYFLEHFPRMQINIKKKLFSLKSFAFENILHCKMFSNETNGAVVTLCCVGRLKADYFSVYMVYGRVIIVTQYHPIFSYNSKIINI